MKKTNFGIISGKIVVATLAMSFIGVSNAYALIVNQLDLGDSNSDVTELQSYLSTNENIYPSKLVTGYFGQLTKAGVERFQTLENIVSNGTPTTTGYGRVGPSTRSVINSRISGGNVTTGDIYAPIIENLTITTGSQSVAVSWLTNELSFGKVYYSNSPIRISNVFDIDGVSSGEPIVSGLLAQYDNNYRTSHTVSINNLAPNTTYYFLVVSYDGLRNSNISSPSTFRTQ